MRFLLVVLIVSFCANHLQSQQNYFVYIQADNQQPFYTRIGDKILSSSASGYAIIPSLKDSVYQLIIGFPKNQWPEYTFNCVISKKDKGYVLKNFAEKGWGLFNLQTMDIIMGIKTEKKTEEKPAEKLPSTNDSFTVMLASVVDDPTLRQTELIPKEKEMIKPEVQKTDNAIAPVIKKDTVLNMAQKPVSADSSAVNNLPVLKDSVVTQASVPVQPPLLLTKINKTLSASTTDGTEMVFTDDQLNGKTDTVIVFIPAEVQIENKEAKVPVKSESGPQTVSVPLNAAKDSVTEVIKDTKTVKGSAKDLSDSASNSLISSSYTAGINPNCTKIATDQDLLLLKRKMIGTPDEDAIIAVAVKGFKQKCYTAENIRSLSYIFLTDEGKYKFLDAAYPYVYDTVNYPALAQLFRDASYINRFNALLQKQ
ncbi:MAG: DUF4476 domain-containing protein [Chitinophagaceae bacterium]|nr:DUF4476 domain-containing protein [Chitinophagaceae bacterium]